MLQRINSQSIAGRIGASARRWFARLADPTSHGRSGLPIGWVLVGMTGLLVLLTTGLIFAAGYRAAWLNTRELVAARFEVVIRSVVERTRSHLDPVRAQLDYLAPLILRQGIGLDRPAQLGTLLTASLAAAPQVSAVAFVTPDLRVLRVLRNRLAPPTVIDDWSEDANFRSAVETAMARAGPSWGELFVAHGVDMPFINLFVPVRSGDRLVGVLIAGVSTQELSQFVAALGEEHLAQAFILRDPEHVLAHPLLANGFAGLSDARPLPTIAEVGDPVLVHSRLRSGENPVDRRPSTLPLQLVQVDGRDHVLLSHELRGYGDTPWLVGAHLPLDQAAPQLSRLNRLLWVGWLVLFAAVVLVFLLGRALSRPFRILADACRRVRDLELETPLIKAQSLFAEINEAADAHNAMVRELRTFATYVPRLLVQRLLRLQGPGGIASEEREVTVLFTDIAGFTSLAETLPASAVADFLNQHFTLVGRCVEDQAGTIDKYIGDSAMAFWGAPGEQPDHADRACRAALAIAAALEADNVERAGAGLPPVRVRMGIQSGRAIVGNIGAPSRVNYTVVGDVVNVAERLEELARDAVGPHEEVCTLVGDATARFLTTGLPLRALGSRVLRGRRRSLEVYQLELRGHDDRCASVPGPGLDPEGSTSSAAPRDR